MSFSKYVPDSRGWFSIALLVLSLVILLMLREDPKLQDNHLFATLAQAIVMTGLINLAASFYFGASKKPNDPPPEDKP